MKQYPIDHILFCMYYNQCYAKHARVVPYHQPPLDPQYIIDATKTSRSMFRDEKLGMEVPVYQINSDTVVKVSRQSLECEALNMLMIQTMTSIPVPKVKQLVIGHKRHYLVMEYINGRTLGACWSQLGFFAQLRIAWTLRGYVSQLRRLQRSVPGRIDGSVCEGYLCTDDGSGPFSSYNDFTSWYNHKLKVAQRVRKVPLDTEQFDNSWPLVFTHGDISPRNIIMAEDGTLFLIDWGYSGFFPVWHECVCMEWDCWQKEYPRSWRRLVPFISGKYLLLE
jgi:aminoglycoside phosphotransferase (APT) family kinase protein